MRKWPGFNKDSDEIIDSKEFYGNIIDQLQEAEKFIRNNSHTGLRKTPNGDRNIWSYPAMAVTEALVNAIVHRDYLNVYMNQIDIDIYKDRIEIVSPGNFYQKEMLKIMQIFETFHRFEEMRPSQML